MKKINALLHDVTVINFKVIFKLLKRYRQATIIASALALIVIPYLYFSQLVIFQKQAHFEIQNKAAEGSGSKGIFSEIMDVNPGYLKRPEVMAIVNSYEFTTALAENLLASEKFKKLDFSNPYSKDTSSHLALTKCSDKNCYLKNLREILPKIFSVEAENGTNRFALVVTTRSRETTLEFLKSFQKALEKVRYEDAVAEVDVQIKKIEELIASRRNELENKGGFDKVASSSFLETMVSQQKDKVMLLGDKLNKERDQFNYQKIRLSQSAETTNTDIEGSEKLGYEKYTKLKKRLAEIHQNIASISALSPTARTESDGQILAQLKNELKETENELSRMGNVKRSIAFDDSFINKQIDNQSSFEFDFKVAGEKLKALQREYDVAKSELDKLYNKKVVLENELLTFKSDIEYLKLLEGKLLSMKMKKSTLGAEVFFDAYGPEVMTFKRNSLVQIVLFSSLIIAFLLMISVVGIYLFDDRIFDEDEIAKCCADIPVIGNTPHFD